MTVISLKHNRYNLVTQKMNWSKKTKVNHSRISLVSFINFIFFGIIILAIGGTLFLNVRMNIYRLNIKDLISQSVMFEQQNAELKNQTAILQNFDQFASVVQKENLILVTAPKYFSLKDKSTIEVGVNNINNL